ncbi:MAG: hypothetical protein IKI95_07975 [Clostridia bacterium]|nr:hypothetical protein [Clostridia bacterium]
MNKEKYTLDFLKDFIPDMEDYFETFTDNKPNYVKFNKELEDNLDFDLFKKELEKVNMSFNFDEKQQQWLINKIGESK